MWYRIGSRREMGEEASDHESLGGEIDSQSGNDVEQIRIAGTCTIEQHRNAVDSVYQGAM